MKRTAPTEVARVFLSVVVPCFDEEAVIGETHRRLVATLDTVPGLDFELVYVDDGSRPRRVRGGVPPVPGSGEASRPAGLREAAGEARCER